MRKRAEGLIAFASLLVIGTSPALSQTGAEFYKNKTVTLVVGSSTGGMYDLLGRLVARYLGAKLPGNPTVIVENRAGGGGLLPATYLYTNAPKDGTVLGLVSNMIPFSPLFGTPQARYDATKFNWIGSSNPETAFLTVWHTVPVNSLADVQRRETTVAASGSAGAPAFFARMLNDVFKTKLKIVVGYPGSAEMFMAMENGEVEGFPSAFTTDLTALKPNWMKEKKVKLLIQYGSHKEEAFPTVPFAPDLITDPEDRAVMEAAFGLLDIGRPFLMPPDVPEERVAIMRKALKDVFEDPAVIAEADKLSIGIDHAQSGEDVQQLVNRVYQTPPRAIGRVRRLLAE